MSAANISALRPLIDPLGIQVIGIGVERIGYADFVAGGFFKGPLFVDEGKQCYNALAMKKNTWRNCWGLCAGQICGLLSVARKKGFGLGNQRGDMSQLGGTFLFEQGTGRTLFFHYQTASSFEPDVRNILGALGIAVPDNFEPYPARHEPA